MIRLCLAKQKLEKDENINTHINNIISFYHIENVGQRGKASSISLLNISMSYWYGSSRCY